MAKPESTDEAAKRLTISPTFDKETYDQICKLAAADERSPAQFLARFVRQKLNEKPILPAI